MSLLPKLLRRFIFRILLVVLTLAMCRSGSLAQAVKVLAPHEPIAPRVKQPFPLPDPVPGSMRGGPWFVDANFKSAVVIKNGVETSRVTVSPVLYLSNGASYGLPDIHLEPSGTAVLDIGESLKKLGIAPYATLSGYVELNYNWPWDPICATIRNLDTTHSLIFNYGLRSSKISPLAKRSASDSVASAPQIVDGLWWKQESNVTAFVALANTTAHSLEVELDVSDDNSRSLGQHATTIPPHATKMLNLDELTSSKGSSGGIRVTYSGEATDLLINGGLEDVGSGYSATVPFASAPASSSASSATVAELGLMTGAADPMMRFPAGTTFTPYTALRNVSNSPMTVTPTVWWMAGGSAQSSRLPAISLSPYQSSSLDVSKLLEKAGLKDFSGSLQLVFDVQGNIGGLLLAAGSVDQTNTYVFDVTPHGISKSASKSMSYWSIANGDDTMVTLWNPADEAADFIFQLTYSGGHYGFPVHLEARATRSFDISEIVKSGIPDADGNTVPVDIYEGAVKITGSHADNEKILIAMDAGTYNVRKATCGTYCQTCNGVTSSAVAANPFSVAVSGQAQLSLNETWNTGSQYNDTSSSSWTTSNSSMATVGTNGSGTAGLVAGVGAGSPTISAQYPYDEPAYTNYWCEGSSWSCPYTYALVKAAAPGTVQMPHALYVLADETGTQNCSLTSVARVITYQIDDTTGTPMATSIPIHENVPVTTSTCNNSIVHTGTGCILNSSYEPGSLNQFDDNLWAGCPSSKSVEPCGFKFNNQQWQYCSAGSPAGSIGTIGLVNAGNALITVDGNSTTLKGTFFGP